MARHNREQNPPRVISKIRTVLKRKWKWILASSMGAGALASVAAFLMSPEFTATSSFVPPSGSNVTALVQKFAPMDGADSLLGGRKISGDLYVGILKSHSVTHVLVQRFNLESVYKVKTESEAEELLAAHTEVKANVKNTIVSVSVTDRDPVRCRDIANTYLDVLRSTISGLELAESSKRRQFLEQRLTLEKNELANAEIALKKDQERSGFIAPAIQTSTRFDVITKLRAQIAAREVALAALRTGESDDNPAVLRVQSQIRTLHSELDQAVNGKGKKSGEFSTDQVPSLELDYIRKARDVKYHEALVEAIAQQYEAAHLDEAREPTFQILDRATVPDTRTGPHRFLIAGAGFLTGFFCITSWLFITTVQFKLGTLLLSGVVLLYVALSLFLFFIWVNPSLTGENQHHIGADSTRYMYFADALREGRNDPFVLAAMATFPNTLWGPVLIALLLNSTVAIMALNYALLLFSLWLLRRAVDVDLVLFLLLVFANVTTSISLLSLNKEITDLFATVLFVYYLARGKRIVLFAALLIAFLCRYETAVVMVMYLLLQSRWNVIRNLRKRTLIATSLVLSVFLSGLLSSQMSSRLEEVIASADSGGLLRLLDNLQMHYLFFVAVVPKILDSLFSELVNVPHWQTYSLDDPANGIFLLGNNLANLGVIGFLILRGRFKLRNDFVYYACLSAMFMSTALVIQPRYFYGAYIMLCIEGARRGPISRPFLPLPTRLRPKRFLGPATGQQPA